MHILEISKCTKLTSIKRLIPTVAKHLLQGPIYVCKLNFHILPSPKLSVICTTLWVTTIVLKITLRSDRTDTFGKKLRVQIAQPQESLRRFNLSENTMLGRKDKSQTLVSGAQSQVNQYKLKYCKIHLNIWKSFDLLSSVLPCCWPLQKLLSVSVVLGNMLQG